MLNRDADPGHLFHSHRQVNRLFTSIQSLALVAGVHDPTTRLKHEQPELH